MTQKQPHWNWMNSGHLSSKKPIKFGFGLLFAERPDKWLHELLETEARKLVVNCRMLFQRIIILDIAILIFGMHTKQSFPKSNIVQLVKRQVKRLMWSVGTRPFGSV